VLVSSAAVGVVAWSLGSTHLALAALHGFALALLWRSARVRRSVRALPLPQRSVVVALVAGLLFGQLLRSSAESFPFPYWDMYVEPPVDDGRVTSVRLDGVRRDGSTVPLELWDVFGIHEGRAGVLLFLQAGALAREDLPAGTRRAIEASVTRHLAWILDATARARPGVEPLAALRLRVAEQPVRGARVTDPDAHRVVADVAAEPAP